MSSCNIHTYIIQAKKQLRFREDFMALGETTIDITKCCWEHVWKRQVFHAQVPSQSWLKEDFGMPLHIQPLGFVQKMVDFRAASVLVVNNMLKYVKTMD